MNKFKLIIIGICSLGLVACGETSVEDKIKTNGDIVNTSTSAETSVDLSSYPIGVQKGFVTPEYSDIIQGFMDEYFTYSNAVSNGFKSDQVDSLKELSSSYVVYLNAINYSPQTDVEKEIHDYFQSALYHQENLGNYIVKYVNTKDSVHKSMAMDEWDSTKADMEILTEILSEYELFY